MPDFALSGAPDIDAPLLRALRDSLEKIFPEPKPMTLAEIENLTEDQAANVIRFARRNLTMMLLFQENHEHMLDDCGDYLQAATESWCWLWGSYFDNDGDCLEHVKEYLLAMPNDEKHPWGGCDGEPRYSLIEEAEIERRFAVDE